MSKIFVKGKFPVNAHLEMPDDTPVETVSTHVDTVRGRINAIKSYARTRAEYGRTHGNAAAFSIWFELDGKKFNHNDYEWLEFQYDAREYCSKHSKKPPSWTWTL